MNTTKTYSDKNNNIILTIPVQLPEFHGLHSDEYKLTSFIDQLWRNSVVGHEILMEMKKMVIDHGLPSDALEESISIHRKNKEVVLAINYRLTSEAQGNLFNESGELQSSVNAMVDETSRILKESSKKSRDGVVHEITSDDEGSKISNSVFSSNPRAVELANRILSKKISSDEYPDLKIHVEGSSVVDIIPGAAHFINAEKDPVDISFIVTVGCVDEFNYTIKVEPRKNSGNLKKRPITISIKPKNVHDFLKFQQEKVYLKISCALLMSINHARKNKIYELVDFHLIEESLF